MKKKRTSNLHVTLYAAAGILIFLLLSTLYDFLVGDINFTRIFTFQIAIIGLITIGSIIGFRKIYHMIKDKL